VSFRGKARILHALCPCEGEATARIFGYQVRLDLKDFIQRSIYLGVFEPEETRLMKGHLRAGMVFVDVGANVGFYSLLAASVGCRVYAFEPSPYASARLKETIRQNQIENITVIESALSEEAGLKNLYVGKTGRNHTPTMVKNEGGTPITVSVQQLDTYARKHGISRIHLMKVDVEGFELNVLRGAHELLEQGRISAILCELNDPWLKMNGSSSRQLYEMLLDFGFRAHKPPDFSKVNQNLFFTLSRP
jgi:FkbM family methyltransferase